MFGHSDDEQKNDHQDAPQHDAVLGGDQSTVHPDQTLPQPHNDAGSPAFTATSPAMPATPPNPDDEADHDGAADAHHEPEADKSAPAEHSDLLDLKQSALQQLSPLVGHLDQTPEEKFRTTMMMIQANDDQSLLKDAYEAAQKITDEKIKAQALLDVINEINYFTTKDK